MSGNILSILSAYGEQQSYQQQVNDQIAYGAPNYGSNAVNLPYFLLKLSENSFNSSYKLSIW